MQPPIKFAIIVFETSSKGSHNKQMYNIGVDICHLSKYNKNAFIFSKNPFNLGVRGWARTIAPENWSISLAN